MRFVLLLALFVFLGCGPGNTESKLASCPAGTPVMSHGCELECLDTHAIAICPVPEGCPDKDGEATAYVYDYTNKPPEGGTTVTRHMLKSVSPCFCVTKTDVCECIPNGVYKGKCENKICTYDIPCNKKK